MLKALRLAILLLFFVFSGMESRAQRYLNDFDSTLFVRDTLRPFLKRYENLHFSGYIQPQFQVIQTEGAESYAGGNFQPFTNNRFMLRRARLKVDYYLPGKNEKPKALFTFQFEATERDVNVRDVFVRLFEPKRNSISATFGLFSRPFGYEVNLSSSFRESPERGRASQILMPSERDMGAMVSFEPRQIDSKSLQFKFDIGLFNGQGKSGPAEFDSFKDLISRLYIRPTPVSKNMKLSGGLSLLYGGWRQATKYQYDMGVQNGGPAFVVDSSLGNIGEKAPRRYYGADLQWTLQRSWGKTEIRGEYWQGRQPGSATTTVNPGTLPITPTYNREFNTAFIYFLQHLGSEKWELMLKYDFYDPNRRVMGGQIGKAGSQLGVADIRYDTFGFGITRYFTGNLKVLIYYDLVRNEETSLPGYESDLRDDVLTLRTQLRF